jgi:hypothetical protein
VTTHELKTWPGPFQDVLEGRKTVELRRDDRGFAVGDWLILREWDPESATYSGRQVVRGISHVVCGPRWGLVEGYVALSLGGDPRPVEKLGSFRLDSGVMVLGDPGSNLLGGWPAFTAPKEEVGGSRSDLSRVVTTLGGDDPGGLAVRVGVDGWCHVVAERVHGEVLRLTVNVGMVGPQEEVVCGRIAPGKVSATKVILLGSNGAGVTHGHDAAGGPPGTGAQSPGGEGLRELRGAAPGGAGDPRGDGPDLLSGMSGPVVDPHGGAAGDPGPGGLPGDPGGSLPGDGGPGVKGLDPEARVREWAGWGPVDTVSATLVGGRLEVVRRRSSGMAYAVLSPWSRPCPDVVWREVYAARDGKVVLLDAVLGTHVPAQWSSAQIVFGDRPAGPTGSTAVVE